MITIPPPTTIHANLFQGEEFLTQPTLCDKYKKGANLEVLNIDILKSRSLTVDIINYNVCRIVFIEFSK